MAEKYGDLHNHFRRYCSTHRRHLNGRMTGWERVKVRKCEDLARREQKCAKCGITGPKGFLDIHHRDGDHSNAKMENLVLLCPSCHRLITLSCNFKNLSKSGASV